MLQLDWPSNAIVLVQSNRSRFCSVIVGSEYPIEGAIVSHFEPLSNDEKCNGNDNTRQLTNLAAKHNSSNQTRYTH